MLPDVNVLVAAHRRDHPHHATASAWLNEAIGHSTSDLVLPMPVLSGFLSVVTHPRILQPPSTLDSAIDFIDWLFENAADPTRSNASEWSAFRQLLLEKQLTANAIPDGWLAALALSASQPFVTFDKGFRKLLPRNLLVLLQPA